MYEISDAEWFAQLFYGNHECFVRHTPPFIVEGNGKVKASKVRFAKDGERFLPVAKALYEKHLNGDEGLAIVPVFSEGEQKNVCFFGVIDIDCKNTVYTGLIQKMRDAGMKFVPFRSKSGGLHIYFFMKKPEPAAEVRELLDEIIDIFGIRAAYKDVEIFPQADYFDIENNKTKALLLPLFGILSAPDKCFNRVITTGGSLGNIQSARRAADAFFTSVKETKSIIAKLPYGDAPPCIQRILLSGTLGETNRNEFLYSCAIYLSKKHTASHTDWLSELLEMNARLPFPLEESEVSGICKSVAEHNYDKYKCGASPLKECCASALCKKREWGVGRKRENVTTGADCWGPLIRVKTMRPYYKWSVRVNPDDEFKEFVVGTSAALQNQYAIQQICWDNLGWAFTRIKECLWVDIVNKAMVGISEREEEVPEETDTTDESVFVQSLRRYLMTKSCRCTVPILITSGSVYEQEGFVYFTPAGVMQHCEYAKGFSGLHAALKSAGCSEASLLHESSRGELRINCWRMAVDNAMDACRTIDEMLFESDASLLDDMTLESGEENAIDEERF